jgi:hypothetical protein
MASEWVKLTNDASKATIYVNLANASSVFPYGRGAEIWFLANAGGEGKIQVSESPDVIMQRLGEVKSARRS